MPAALLSATVQPEDVYELSWVSDPRIAPDGRSVAFVVWRVDREANDYRSAIWVGPVDGSSPPRRFTSGEKLDVSPRWSPDGDRLAFASSREREAKQLYVIPTAGGEGLRLTELDEDVTEPTWSPDGTRLAFSSRVRHTAYEVEDDKRRRPRRFSRLQYKLDDEGWTGDRRRHIFTVPADGSTAPTQLTDGDYEDHQPMWSPDGRRIAFASLRQDDWDIELLQDVYLVDAQGGEPTRLTASDAWHEAPSWAPDGSLIACQFAPGGFDEPHHGQIAVLDAATGERRILTAALDRNCAPYPPLREPIWDGDSLLFALEERGNTLLYRVRADGSGAAEPVVVLAAFLTATLVAGALAPAAAQSPKRSERSVKPPQVTRRERTRNLDFLFGALKVAPDDVTAKAIEERIWTLWTASQSDTANLLMTRVKTAIEAKDLDLAIKLLDAIVKVKPDYVEA